MFNDDITIGEFNEGAPAVVWPGYADAAIWRRIEQYIVWRWGERSVEWIIQGGRLFTPPLRPVTITTVEVFNEGDGPPSVPAGEWTQIKRGISPFGVRLPRSAFYRIRGTAGQNDPPPADVLEAYTRLAEYIAGVKDDGRVGATSVTDSIPGVTLTVHRPVNSLSRALEYSGAADLLKAYRHV
ncbi:MAG: hypothetical protein LBQ32_06920 [Burkholderiaceae bacterium]|jgi:hypothetical protein|nr:hypothetical protein [Burkholderiaceae bacterium]